MTISVTRLWLDSYPWFPRSSTRLWLDSFESESSQIWLTTHESSTTLLKTITQIWKYWLELLPTYASGGVHKVFRSVTIIRPSLNSRKLSVLFTKAASYSPQRILPSPVKKPHTHVVEWYWMFFHRMLLPQKQPQSQPICDVQFIDLTSVKKNIMRCIPTVVWI